MDKVSRSSLKRLAALLPRQWQQELKRHYFGFLISRGQFRSAEPEYDLLPELVSEGNWVLDVGANVGHYTARLSQLVGRHGRVIAIEPIPDTFELLATNVGRLTFQNTTLIGAAASSSTTKVHMAMPQLETGLANYYQAHISTTETGTEVITLSVDALRIPSRVALVKIDAEGHDLEVLKGMTQLLKRDGPILIVEGTGKEVAAFLGDLGYSGYRMPGSPNSVFDCRNVLLQVLGRRGLVTFPTGLATS